MCDNFLPPEWLHSVLHFPNRDYLSNPYPALGETIIVRLRAPVSAPIGQVVLCTFPNGEQQLTPMQPEHEENGWRWWGAELTVREPHVSYRFAIQTREAVWWLNAAGVGQALPFELFDFKLLANTSPIPWLRDAVFYQISRTASPMGIPAMIRKMKHSPIKIGIGRPSLGGSLLLTNPVCSPLWRGSSRHPAAFGLPGEIRRQCVLFEPDLHGFYQSPL